ncbi:TetR/AcrR family transcriptional regulator [Roseivivax sediminis]|uniref:DNA-binding transcriptional regulator, AcrR family n=1 Tax=Roseivivax sediminis TaxID=936889 RepID=A0A1I1UCU1_9RHOB|nr:TetR/AcrR family transcriptional regulator [Roseivivax sediminis]SFD68557.1 DNA-binding transcriptional regulator, AcrR family [Roseivivax sediminis]
MTGCPDSPARRGRPPALDADERRDLILDALQAVFDRAGMAGVTMAAVAQEAGMSKRTLYAVFDDRAALLEAYTERHMARAVRKLTPQDIELPLAQRLRRLLAPSDAMRSLSLPFAIIRTIIAEAPERPDMASRIFQHGLPAVRAAIRTELDRANARGEADIADTEAAAALLTDMVRPSPLDRLVDPARPFDFEAVSARFELGLSVFLRGVGAET